MPADHNALIAHHLIMPGYGFWIANDPRGSGSEELREMKFAPLGDIHHGRKRLQPTRRELRDFYRQATPNLEHRPIWFDDQMRGLLGEEIGRVIARCGYTVWECFVGSNHAHLCIRRHRDTYEQMFSNFSAQTRATFADRKWIDEKHPLWADRPYSVFCSSEDDVRRTIQYIRENAEKEGLPRQMWAFVKEYDGWPFKRTRR